MKPGRNYPRARKFASRLLPLEISEFFRIDDIDLPPEGTVKNICLKYSMRVARVHIASLKKVIVIRTA